MFMYIYIRESEKKVVPYSKVPEKLFTMSAGR